MLEVRPIDPASIAMSAITRFQHADLDDPASSSPGVAPVWPDATSLPEFLGTNSRGRLIAPPRKLWDALTDAGPDGVPVGELLAITGMSRPTL